MKKDWTSGEHTDYFNHVGGCQKCCFLILLELPGIQGFIYTSKTKKCDTGP